MRRWLIMISMTLLVACSTQTQPTPLPAPTTPPIALANPSPSVAPQPIPTVPPDIRATPIPSTTPAPLTSTPPASTPFATATYDDSGAIETSIRQVQARDPMALALAWGAISQTATLPVQPIPEVGDRTTFWVVSFNSTKFEQITATLKVQSEHLRIYEADNVTTDVAELQNAADLFEQHGWQLLSRWYDTSAWPTQPITVLNARIDGGAGGYYPEDNLLPRGVNPYSNERALIYINARITAIDSPQYVGLLIQETQGMLHHHAHVDSPMWFKEGLSVLAQHRSGYGTDDQVLQYLKSPDIQLNSWSITDPSRYYGATELFLRYVDDQTGGLPIGDLIQADAGDNLNAWMEHIQTRYPDLETFPDLYATWAVANLVNDATLTDGRYGYPSLPGVVTPQVVSSGEGTVKQLGTDYLEWEPADLERQVRWEGNGVVPILTAPVTNDEQIWWSGRGDAQVSTLTTAVTVPDSGGTLQYRTWYALEQDFDYAYLTVSTDDGNTWQSIETPSSTTKSRYGLNLGQGWTGNLKTWRQDAIDLAPWRGQSIQLRFWMITDPAETLEGLALADLLIDTVPSATWTGTGFVQIHNQLPQQWELRGVLYPPDGPPQIAELEPTENQVSWTIPPQTRAVLVVVGGTPASREAARYRYTLEP